MPLDFVVNDLSYREPAADVFAAQTLMEKFIIALRGLLRIGRRGIWNPQLRMDHTFLSSLLAPNYSIAKWRNDESVDRDLRRFLVSLATRAPYLEGVDERQQAAFPPLYEFHHGGRVAAGLGFAYLLRGVAVSFAREEWLGHTVTVDAHIIEPDSDLQFSVELPHASDADHCEPLRGWILRRLDEESRPPTSFDDLWERRLELLAGLDFCHEVETQLKSLDPGVYLKQVFNCLLAMNEYSERWRDSLREFSHHDIAGLTPESTSRIDAYGGSMRFTCPDGAVELFTFHGRYTPGAGRVHIFPDRRNRRIVIGYIGRKIGT